jgi:mono/diheme cytochrome c family protein
MKASVPAVALVLLASGASAQDAGKGETLFRKQCGICHSPGGFGTNMLEQRKDGKSPLLTERGPTLDEPYIHAAVRKGIGSMVRFTPAELTDADIRDIASFLTRKQAP